MPRTFSSLYQHRRGLLLFPSYIRARNRRTAYFAVERSGTVGLALCGFIALFANEIIPARVNYPLVGTDFIFSDVDALGWHGVEKCC